MVAPKQNAKGGIFMPTKSFLKNVIIKDKIPGMQLVTALETASQKHPKEIHLKEAYEDVHGDKTRSILEKKVHRSRLMY